MHFLRPEAWWLLLLVVIPVVLYLLPLPRLRKSFPSIMVWRRLAERHRLAMRRNLVRVLGSIVLSVVILVLVIAAFGRLVVGGRRTAEAGRVVVVLDTSASMQAAEGPVSRFERARGHASALVQGLPAGTTVSLVTTAPAPRLVVRPTRETDRITDVLRPLTPSGAAGSLTRTLAWVEDAFGTEDIHVHIFTDGACERPRTALDVTWHRFGGALPNVGIVGFGVRRVDVPQEGVLVQARVGNFSPDLRPVTLLLRRDGTALEPKAVELAADSVTAAVWTLAGTGAGTFELEVTPGDRFTCDDRATAVLEPTRRRRVILVAENPPVHLLAALRADDTVQTFLTKPENYRADLASDLTIFTGTLPDTLGPENVLVVNPAVGTPFLKLTGETVKVGPVGYDARHPLLADVVWRPGLVRTASKAETPSWAEAVLEGPEGPLMLAGTRDGRRAVVLTFDPETERLVHTRTFPLLVRNIVDWLAPIPVGGEVASQRSDEPTRPANLCDAAESDLRPRLKLDPSADAAAGGVPPAYLWTVMILSGVVLLAVEAVLYHRRVLE